jgi:hypothetical protein
MHANALLVLNMPRECDILGIDKAKEAAPGKNGPGREEPCINVLHWMLTAP